MDWRILVNFIPRLWLGITGACANDIIPSINRSFVYKPKEERHVRILIYILISTHCEYLSNHLLALLKFLASMIYFDSDMSKSTNKVVYFDWKTVFYIYACGKCRTKNVPLNIVFLNCILHKIWIESL
jgi:hypothetical protein